MDPSNESDSYQQLADVPRAASAWGRAFASNAQAAGKFWAASARRSHANISNSWLWRSWPRNARALRRCAPMKARTLKRQPCALHAWPLPVALQGMRQLLSSSLWRSRHHSLTSTAAWLHAADMTGGQADDRPRTV
jgi:hypothetical protein